MDKKSAFILGLGTVLGISHIGMIGMLSNNSSFPKFDLPIGKYTAYRIEADKTGYKIDYRAHDPKIVTSTEQISRPAGFLGMGKKNVDIKKQNVVGETTNTTSSGLTEKQIACIKARGSGEGTGKMVGGALGAATVTQTGVSSIPIVGWVIGGAISMFGMDQGAEIGGQMAVDFADCDEEIITGEK